VAPAWFIRFVAEEFAVVVAWPRLALFVADVFLEAAFLDFVFDEDDLGTLSGILVGQKCVFVFFFGGW